jgi:DNA-3-methyladenine glycosylase I
MSSNAKKKAEKYSGPTDGKTRCGWCLSDPLYVQYHDQEWGKPIHDDQLLFEFLVLGEFSSRAKLVDSTQKARKFQKSLCSI